MASDAAKWLLGKIRSEPKGQIRGPIQAGPRGYRRCRLCQQGVPVRRWRSHRQSHKDGFITKPVGPKKGATRGDD